MPQPLQGSFLTISTIMGNTIPASPESQMYMSCYTAAPAAV